jgi:hypothetical protein
MPRFTPYGSGTSTTMHLALPAILGTIGSTGLVSALVWDWWRHPDL